MSSQRYLDEFKIEAIRRVTDRGFKRQRSTSDWLSLRTVYTSGRASSESPAWCLQRDELD
ncbi:hypothetical protein J169_04111 [Xanthomonas citri pv. citri]|nr:hypothetical protein J151_04114 [Xanthomonas citri subsp. citri A306]AJY92893.1 hypothetical protein J169_04111 [Xanthomonas citri pv. citri]QYF46866.1 IS3 family transposase [Xanthomonas citri]AJZ10633.1 hypothetical protein J172_04104 [Xanthomonas citri pv. citri]AJZ32801.1 hypothetical protein J171_04106 [Xanthomonas citri pv. citri]